MGPSADMDVPLPKARAVAIAQLVTRDTNLRVTTFNTAAGVTLTIIARLVDPITGGVSFNQYDHIPNTNGTLKQTTHPLAEGWLVSLQVVASAGTPRRGQCAVRVELIEGFSGALTSVTTLLNEYAADTTAIAWPGAPLRHSADGPGVIRSILGTDPGAGVEISEAVPTNTRWRVLGFDAALVTDVTVATRDVVLTIDDGANIVAEIAAGASQIASLTRRYSFARGLGRGAGAASNAINAPLPDAILMGGYRIRTVTTAIVAGDNWGPPQLWVEEWIED